MSKLTLLIAGGIGYVLGARAGRERYDQILGAVNKAWGSEPVRDAVDQVKDQAPQVVSKVGDGAKAAASKTVAAVRGKAEDDSSEEPEASTP